MVPAGDPTRQTVEQLGELLSEGDLVIDGGNSKWLDDAKNAAHLRRARASASSTAACPAAIWGKDLGYGLMCGGAAANVELAMPVFDALRPEGPREEGFVHAGEVGAGHYTKMVHNGIEYGLMQAYAEGYELLLKKDLVTDVPGAFKAWSRGTVVRSWLLDLMVRALEQDPELDEIRGYVDDTGEGRWTVQEGVENAVPMPVISAALFARFVSRQDDSPAMKAVAALRNQFGGHAVKAVEVGPSAPGSPSSAEAR